jgi:hypothetical protein
VVELAGLCSTNRQMRSSCLQLLREQSLQQTGAVLVTGLADALFPTTEFQQKATQAVWWLLDTALPPGIAAELLQQPGLNEKLNCIPNFPLHLAEGLCQRGLCMSYTSIAAAACGEHRVAGAPL